MSLQKKPSYRFSLLNPFLEQQRRRNRKVVQIVCSSMRAIGEKRSQVELRKKSNTARMLPFISDRLNCDKTVDIEKDDHQMQSKQTQFDIEKSNKGNTNQINKYKYVFEDDIKAVKNLHHKKQSSSVHFASNTDTDLSTVKAN